MKRKTDFANKPYNRCISCPHRGEERCNGPRTSDMPLSNWCAYMRDMRDFLGLTNGDIAGKAEVSVKTIERIMALNADQDIMRDTARRIENAILGSCNNYPCYLAYEEENKPDEQKLNEATRELERALADNKDYRAALDNIHESYKVEMEIIRSDAQKKIDFLLEQIARLRDDNDRLWAENIRKSKVVDMFLPLIQKHNALHEEKKSADADTI